MRCEARKKRGEKEEQKNGKFKDLIVLGRYYGVSSMDKRTLLSLEEFAYWPYAMSCMPYNGFLEAEYADGRIFVCGRKKKKWKRGRECENK
jgi:hypothetical protein